MAWRFLHHKRPPVPPLAPVQPASTSADLPALRIACNRHGYGTAPPSLDVVIQARYPRWVQRDERGVLIEVLGWQEGGPRPGMRR